jgi:Ca2+-binding EF-hand superfamily protein
MATNITKLSSSYHAPLAIISVLALLGTALYFHKASNPPPPRALHRSNATRRSIRTSLNASREVHGGDSTNEGVASQNSHTNHNEPEREVLGDADAEYDGDGNETENDVSLEPPSAAPLGLKELVYYIASNNAEQTAVVHRGVVCGGCDANPIRGIRYKCLNCLDFDLCPSCESLGRHNSTHMLVQIKIPAPFIGAWKPQKVAYPMREPSNHELSEQTISELRAKYSMDKPKLRMLYQHFKAYATVSTTDGHQVLQWGIDRETFGNICFYPLQGNPTLRNNLIIDRIFSVWSNEIGFIGFDEFLAKLSFSGNPNSISEKAETVFKALDLDGDGFVIKDDFLRIFEAHYEISAYFASVHMDLEAYKRIEAIQESELHKPLRSHWQELVGNEDYFGRGRDFNSSVPIEAFDPLRHTPTNQLDLGPVNLDIFPRSVAITGLRNDEISAAVENTSVPVVASNGFELPATHVDDTKETLRQIARQGFQALVDPLFKDLDSQATPVLLSQRKRQLWKAEIKSHQNATRMTASESIKMTPSGPDMAPQQPRHNPYEASIEWLTQDSTLPQYRPNDQLQLEAQLQALCLWDDAEGKLTKKTSDGSLAVRMSLKQFIEANRNHDQPFFLWTWFNISSF